MQQPLQSICYVLTCFLLIYFAFGSQNNGMIHRKAQTACTVVVDKRGTGDFTTVQRAIDSVLPHQSVWTLVHVKAGVYNEQVTIPKVKPYVILEGEGISTTSIQWGAYGSSRYSSTFKALADNFVARNIEFKNTHDVVDRNHRKPGKENEMAQAPAAMVHADKAAFYNVSFVSLQDTLTDLHGRHYFESCYIQGGVDFIWGYGQSIYQECVLNVTASAFSHGYITAQGRNSPAETNGFVFKDCAILGSGRAFLGRAYKEYSRVIFFRTYMSKIIDPQGWFPWDYANKTYGFSSYFSYFLGINLGNITYSEIDCYGPGSHMAGRVKWEKTLRASELQYFTSVDQYINTDRWLQI